MFKFFGIVLIFCSVGQVSYATIGAVSTATGGSGRGAIEPVDGVLLNPSTISDMPNKNFSVSYSTEQLALSVSDSGADSVFPAALGFVKTTTDVIDTQKLNLSLATRRWKRMAFGVSASMLEYTNYIPGPQEKVYHQSAVDLAATVALTRDLGFGIVANKVSSSQVDLPEAYQIQRTTAVGLSYTYMNFARLRLDVESAPENKTDKLVYMTGLENYVNDWVVFRLGYQNNNVVNKNYFSAGLGFAGPQFGLHYAYISNVSDKSEEKHLIDLGIPF